MPPNSEARPRPASPSDLFVSFTWLALQGFGGVLAVAQRVLCDDKRWLTKEQFVEMLAIGQVLPGPNVCNIALMVDIARRNHFSWDAVLGSEIARDFKPKAQVYLASAEALGLAPGDCTMVAAHSSDLAAAAALGLRTAHVARPAESLRCRFKPKMRCRANSFGPRRLLSESQNIRQG